MIGLVPDWYFTVRNLRFTIVCPSVCLYTQSGLGDYSYMEAFSGGPQQRLFELHSWGLLLAQAQVTCFTKKYLEKSFKLLV